MVVFNPLLLFVALAHFAPFVSTQPLDPNTTPSLSERADVCYNAPGTKAGSFLKRSEPDSLANLSPRGPSDFPGKSRTNWCAAGCQTYIRVIYVAEIPAGKTNWGTVHTYVANAIKVISLQISMGDKVIPHGGWLYGHNFKNTYDLELWFRNSNNHQLTWGVNRAAVVALADYFNVLEPLGVNPGAVQFTIVDGENEVATGVFGMQGQWTGVS